MNGRGPCAISKQAAECRASDSHYQPLPYLHSDFICKDALKTSQRRKHAMFISPIMAAVLYLAGARLQVTEGRRLL